MRIVTATDASRSFAALLDEVERGESVVVTRAGKRIAFLSPAPRSNGAEVARMLTTASIDTEFEADLEAVRANVRAPDPVWPDD